MKNGAIPVAVMRLVVVSRCFKESVEDVVVNPRRLAALPARAVGVEARPASMELVVGPSIRRVVQRRPDVGRNPSVTP